MPIKGAEHTRFTHSIGVSHMVGKILNHLQEYHSISEDQIFLTRCAALLHDIGHAPFSHVLEKHFQKNLNSDSGHELWSS